MDHITVNLQNAEKPRTPPSKHSELNNLEEISRVSRRSSCTLPPWRLRARSRSAWGGATARWVRRRHGNHAILGPPERWVWVRRSRVWVRGLRGEGRRTAWVLRRTGISPPLCSVWLEESGRHSGVLRLSLRTERCVAGRAPRADPVLQVSPPAHSQLSTEAASLRILVLRLSLCLPLGALWGLLELALKILKGLHFLKKKFSWFKRPLRFIPLPQLRTALSAFLDLCFCLSHYLLLLRLLFFNTKCHLFWEAFRGPPYSESYLERSSLFPFQVLFAYHVLHPTASLLICLCLPHQTLMPVK